MAYSGEGTWDPLTLLFYPTEGADDSSLYEDAGDGFGYEDGEYAKRTVSCEEAAGSVTVRIMERLGSFVPQRQVLRLELRGFGSAPESVEVNGEAIESSYDEEIGAVIVALDEAGDDITVEVVR
jgi:alpha-glucosidase